MAEGLPWFPFYASDWLTAKKVRRLTWSQRGVYATLLAEQWVGGALPCDHTEVAALVGATPDDVRAVLDACFFPAVEGWKNERLEEVRAEQAAKSSALAKAGRKGGKAKQRNKLDGASQATARLQPGSSIRVEQSRVEQSRVEEKREKPARRKREKKQASERPADWKPNEGHHERARATRLECLTEAEKFKAWHDARGMLMVNWDAAFTTWLMKAQEFAQARTPPDSEAARHTAESEDWRIKRAQTEARTASELRRLNVAALVPKQAGAA